GRVIERKHVPAREREGLLYPVCPQHRERKGAAVALDRLTHSRSLPAAAHPASGSPPRRPTHPSPPPLPLPSRAAPRLLQQGCPVALAGRPSCFNRAPLLP